MKIGIVGLPNVGKSSLFNLLTNAGAEAQPYPFTTIDANHGMAVLSDSVLTELGNLLKPKKLTFAQIEVVDIAGLIKDAHKGEGLGNKFLGHIRDVDLIIHLIRSFENNSIPHVFESIDSKRDVDIILSELALADLEITERRLQKQKKRSNVKEEVALLDNYHRLLSSGHFNLNGSFSDADKIFLKSLGLLIPRPRIDICNFADTANALSFNYPECYRLSVSLEEGISEFSNSEKEQLRAEIGVDVHGLEGILEEARKKLGLIRFYTVKGDEVRAWLIKEGSTALEAAEKIHADIAAGFIKTEVVRAEDLIACGSWLESANQGKMKIEGKDYLVQDRDVLLIKFR